MSLPDWNDADLQAAAPILDQWIAFYNLPANVIYGQASQESRFKPNAYRAEPQINDASRGIMQVLYKTAQGLGYGGTPDGLFDPNTSINLGTQLMAQNLVRYGNIFDALSAYNAGQIGTTAGSRYATQVLARAEYFASLWAATQPVDTTNTVPVVDGTTPAPSGNGSSVVTIAAVVIGGAILAAVIRALSK